MMPINTTRFAQSLRKLLETRAEIESVLSESRDAQIKEKQAESMSTGSAPQIATPRRFFNSVEKSYIARLAKINKLISAAEASYNARYKMYENHAIDLVQTENKFDAATVELERIEANLLAVKGLFVIATNPNDKMTYLAQISNLNAELILTTNKRVRIERHLAGLLKKKPQKLKSLIEFKLFHFGSAETLAGIDTSVLATIRDAALAHKEGRVIVSNKVETESPLSILRNMPTSEVTEEVTKADHVRIEPKTPNPMDEFMKGFFNDSPKVQDNDTTEEEN